MISHLKGIVESVSDNSMILDVNGVGYNVLASSRTLSAASSSQGIVHIYTVLNVREDAWVMYGFISEKERFWFNTLISVQGVGGKAAISILSALSDDDIYNAFLSGDKNIFTKADGIGAKIASRIVSELKEKVIGKMEASIGIIGSTEIANNEPSVANDVISALMNLGYQKSDIYRIISSMNVSKNDKFEVVLKNVLSRLSSGV